MSVEWRADMFMTALEAQSTAALFAGAEHIRQTSINLTPIESGDLRQSTFAQAEGDAAVVANPLVYAARQHEETGWNHPRGGQAKYLETAFNNERDKVLQMLAHQLGGAFG